MKNIILYLLLFGSLGVMAQQKEQNPVADFVVLTSQIDFMDPLIMAAQDSNRNGDLQIVLYGNEVKQIPHPSMRKSLDYGEKYKIRFAVCKMSLDKLKIDPNRVPKGVKIVDNAFLYGLQLQKRGYKSLSL